MKPLVNDWVPRTLAIVLALAAFVISIAGAPPADWRATVSASGSVRLEMRGREIGTLEPGLFEAGWKSASLAPAKPGAAASQDRLAGQIRAPGGAVVDTELRITKQADGLHFAYRL